MYTVLDGFPDEICTQILSFVTKRDLKSLRLAGQFRLTDIATERLFTTTYVAARGGVLDAFRALSLHPILRHHVKDLVFDFSWFEPHMITPSTLGADDASSENVENEVSSEKVESIHKDKQLAIKQLAVLYADQEMIQTGELRSCFKSAIRALPEIRRVIYAVLSRVATLPGDVLRSKAWDQDLFLQRQLCGKPSKTIWPCGRCCMRYTYERSHGLEGKKHKDIFRREQSSLLTLLKILSENVPDDFEELSLGDISPLTGSVGQLLVAYIPYYLITRPDIPSPVNHALVILGPHLRKMSLKFSFPNCGPSSVGPPADTHAFHMGTRAILRNSEKLEELSLSGEVNKSFLDLKRLNLNNSLPVLKKLQFRTMEADFKCLSTFPWCHRNLLRTLKLDDFNLLSESWPKLMDFAQKAIPEAELTIGFTWVQGVIRPISWSPGDLAENEEGSHDDHEDDDDGSDCSNGGSNYSDCSDVETTIRVIGYENKKDQAGQPVSDDDHYEDLTEVCKRVKDISDSDEGRDDSDKDDDSESSDSDSESRYWQEAQRVERELRFAPEHTRVRS